MLRVFIRQFYEGRAFVPGELFVSHALEDAGWIEEGLAAQKGHKVRIHRPERGEKARLLDIALQNARTELATLLTRRSNDAELLPRLQRRLNLSRCPQRIECVDNSTLMGSDPWPAWWCSSAAVRSHPPTGDTASREWPSRMIMHPCPRSSAAGWEKADIGAVSRSVDGGRRQGTARAALAVMKDLQIEGRMDVIGLRKKTRAEGKSTIRFSGRDGRIRSISAGKATCCFFYSGSGTRRTAIPSPFIGGAAVRRPWPRCWTRSPHRQRPQNAADQSFRQF